MTDTLKRRRQRIARRKTKRPRVDAEIAEMAEEIAMEMAEEIAPLYDRPAGPKKKPRKRKATLKSSLLAKLRAKRKSLKAELKLVERDIRSLSCKRRKK